MDGPTALGILAVLFLVLMNGFFVATEFAIVAVRRSRLDQLARLKATPRPPQLAMDVVGHLDAYIAACQLGITIASLALGWIGEPAFAHLVEPPLEAPRWAAWHPRLPTAWPWVCPLPSSRRCTSFPWRARAQGARPAEGRRRPRCGSPGRSASFIAFFRWPIHAPECGR